MNNSDFGYIMKSNLDFIINTIKLLLEEAGLWNPTVHFKSSFHAIAHDLFLCYSCNILILVYTRRSLFTCLRGNDILRLYFYLIIAFTST